MEQASYMPYRSDPMCSGSQAVSFMLQSTFPAFVLSFNGPFLIRSPHILDVHILHAIGMPHHFPLFFPIFPGFLEALLPV